MRDVMRAFARFLLRSHVRSRVQHRGPTIITLAALVATLLSAAPASAESVTVGYGDMSYAAAGVRAPTGEKPQSKLWHNDGQWWGALYSRAAGAFTVHRLDKASQNWVDTGTVLDDRNYARLDVLWDGANLYVIGAGPDPASSQHSAEVTRYRYDSVSGTYARDPDAVTTVVEGGAEAVVMDKDTTGKLWMTFIRDRRVLVAHSVEDDMTWTQPFQIPTTGSDTLGDDDLSAVVAYKNRIGVMWSDQADGVMYFASHADGDPDDAWALDRAVEGPEYADDHLNIKSLQSDGSGRVYAITKTSLNAPSAPLMLVLRLDEHGTWSRTTFGRVADNHTRPLILIDAMRNKLYAFAASPCCSGGAIYYKESDLDNLNFVKGLGTPFIQSETDVKINNPASTKQEVSPSTGLVVIASDDHSKRYLHNYIDLSKGVVPPDTIIDSGPTGTVSPDDAVFTFSSSKADSTFECSLDGKPFSTCSSPVSYPDVPGGSHTFAVRAIDVDGLVDPTPATQTWQVNEALHTEVFTPAADAYVSSRQPAANHGNDDVLVVDGGDRTEQSYVKFDVSGIDGTVVDARLRVFATNGTYKRPDLATTSTNWGEHTIVWDNRPDPTSVAGGGGSDLPANSWGDYDVGDHVTGDGAHSFVLSPLTSDGADLASRESATHVPELVVRWEDDGAPSTPDTTITDGPQDPSEDNDATLAFTSDVADAVFECRLDDAAYESCTSPTRYADLANGVHVFDVRARNSVGVADPTPASHTWTIKPPTATAVDDNFESGDLSAWTEVVGGDGTAAVTTQDAVSGTHSAELSASTNTGSRAYIRSAFGSARATVTVDAQVKVVAEGAAGANVPLVRMFDDQSRVVQVYRQNQSGDRVYVNYAGSYIRTSGTLPLDTWAHMVVHVATGAGDDTVTVKLDGVAIHEGTAELGGGVLMVQFGNDTSRQAFRLRVDDALVTTP